MGYGMAVHGRLRSGHITRMDGWADCHDGAWIHGMKHSGEVVYEGYEMVEVERDLEVGGCAGAGVGIVCSGLYLYWVY